VLSLALFTAGPRPARAWVLPLGADGRLPRAELDRLVTELDAALGVAPESRAAAAGPGPRPERPPSPEPPEAIEAPRPLEPPEPIEPPPRREPSTPAPAPGPDEPAVRSRDAPSVAELPRPVRSQALLPWLAVEAGVEAARRSLRFPPGGTAPVGYSVDVPAMPRLRLELHPLEAGAAVFAEAAYLSGIGLSAGTVGHRATALQARGGLGWRLPVGGWLLLEPAVAYEVERFTVGSTGGAKVAGLPDTRLAGVSAGLGLELRAAGSSLALLLGGRGTWWLDARDLAGQARFFPSGSAFALEGEAGVAIALGGPLSLRALGDFATTRWSLGVDPSGAYTVRSGRGDSWGGRVMLRFER
jgi:hypothetical protein